MEKLKEQFNKIISYSQDIPNPQTEEIFNNWKNNKFWFIKNMLHNEYIYEHPELLEFHLTQEEKEFFLHRFIRNIRRKGYNELSAFLEAQKTSIFDNCVTQAFQAPDGTLITCESKIAKAFKHFNLSPTVLRKLQDEFSCLIQEDKIKGKLCLSVHPLDYLDRKSVV